MDDFIEIHWTAGSIDEARKISRFLVQERYVACAQITPWIESIYLWNGRLETSQESKIVMKAIKSDYDVIKKVILENCSYEVPEISYIHVDGANNEYLQWVEETLKRNSQK